MSETTEQSSLSAEIMAHDTTIDHKAELLASMESPEDSALISSLEMPPAITEEDQPSFPIPVEDAPDTNHRSEIDGVNTNNRNLSEIEGVDVINHKLSDPNGIEIINHKSDPDGVDIINHNLPEVDDASIANHKSELEGDDPDHNSEPNGINTNDNNFSELSDADIITHQCKLDFVDTNHKSELDGISSDKHNLSQLDDVDIIHQNSNELDDDIVNHKTKINGVDTSESSSDTVEEKPLNPEVIPTSDDVREVVEGVPTYFNILEVSPGPEEISEAIIESESSLQEGAMNDIDEEVLTVVPTQQEGIVSTEGDVEAPSPNSNEEEYVKSRDLHEEAVTLVPGIEEDDKSELTEGDAQSALPRISSSTISKDEHVNPNEEDEEEALTLAPIKQEGTVTIEGDVDQASLDVSASGEVEYVESNGEEVLSALDPPTQDDTNANTEGDIDASLASSDQESLNSREQYNSTLSKIEDIVTSVTEEDDLASTLPANSPSENGLKEAHVNPNEQEKEETPSVQTVQSLGDDIVSTLEDVTGIDQNVSKDEINECIEESRDEESRSTNTNHEGIPREDEMPSSVDVPHDDLVSPSPQEIPIEKTPSPENAIENEDNQVSLLKPEAVLDTPTSTFDLVSPDPHEIPIEMPLSTEEAIGNANSRNPMLASEIDPETPISTFDLVSPDPHEIPIEKPLSTEEPIENANSQNLMIASEVVHETPTSTIDLVSPTPHEIPTENPLSPEEPLENGDNQASLLASEVVPETPASTIDSVFPTPHEISKGETLSPEEPLENADNQNSVLASEIVLETPASTIDSVSPTPHEIPKGETLSPEEPLENVDNQNSGNCCELASEIVPETPVNTIDSVSQTPHEISKGETLSPEEPLENADIQNPVLASEIVPETPTSTIDSVSPTPHEIPKGETLSPEEPVENTSNQNSVVASEIVPETPASTIDSVSPTPHEIHKGKTLSPEEPIANIGNQNSAVALDIVPETNQNSMVASEIVPETPTSAVEKLCNGSPPLPKACGGASADGSSQELIMMSYAQQEVEELVPTIKLEQLDQGNLANPDQSTDGPDEIEKLIEQIPFEEEARKFKETKLYGGSSSNSSYFDGYDEIPQQAQGSNVNEIIDENEVEKHVESNVSSRFFGVPSQNGLEDHSQAREDEQIHLGFEECSRDGTNGDEGVGLGENDDHTPDKDKDYSKTENDVMGKEKGRFRMKLPLLVTGIAIAAVGVAVASIGRSH